jgi:alkanesulfonate monooxygenase SsuD/methylene tetrahydromethanopterin reductase-like flavin-dependent oxidoreductase (luciferase family)
VVAVARDEGELAHRAEAIGRTVEDLRANGIAGLPAEAVDRLGTWRERTGIDRIYLQLLDLSDLDHLELIAAQVMPQLR